MKTRTLVAPLGLLVLLASPAAAQDFEMICVSALSDQAGVDMSKIASEGTEQAGEGTKVNLKLDGTANWDCYVNDAGEVTLLELEGGG